ncbi:MAG TPA: hypothetical protein VEK34_11370 [Methylocella sp.]|nr:hypothetical protein [Methylocella sp.]
MVDLIFVVAGLLCLAPLVALAMRQRRKTVTAALPLAVDIASLHGFVSPGRLMARANISEKDAKEALAEACRQGLLSRGEDGRYFMKQPSIDGPAPSS